MGHPSRVSDADWAAAKHDYERGVAVAELARRLNCSRSNIHSRASRYEWQRPQEQAAALSEIEARLNRLSLAILKGIESVEGRARALDARARELAADTAEPAELALRQELLQRTTDQLARVLAMTADFTRLLSAAAKAAAKARTEESGAKESYETFQLRFIGELVTRGAGDVVERLVGSGPPAAA